MKKSLLLLITMIMLTGCADLYKLRDGEHKYELDYFGEETYSELREEISDEDREELQPVMDLAEEAFSSFPDNEDRAQDEYGGLWVYTGYDHDPKTCTEKHSLELETGKVSGSSGYVWVNYSQEYFDQSGKLIEGSWKVRSRWTVEKQKSEWKVTKISEPA